MIGDPSRGNHTKRATSDEFEIFRYTDGVSSYIKEERRLPDARKHL